MSKTIIIISALLFVIAGCLQAENRGKIRKNNTSISKAVDAEYQKLYYDYRSLVMNAIKNNKEVELSSITDEYAKKLGKNIFLVTISKLDPSGKWKVLLHKTDPNTSVKLPKIHFASSKSVHIHEGKNFVLCESNKTNGIYKDNIHIRLAIQR